MSPIERIRTRVFCLKQKAFAEMIGVSQGTVSRWERGTLEPSISQLVKIRDAAYQRELSLNDSWFFEVPSVRPSDQVSA